MVRHKRPHGLRLRSLFLWHRWLGLSTAVFVLALAITGLLINYSDDLHLDQRDVQSEWLLDWYGIAPPATVVSYPAAAHWISQVGERLYFDDHELEGNAVPLHGAVQIPGGIAIAGGDQVLLTTTGGALIDRLGSLEGVPSGIEAVGGLGPALLVRTPTGTYQGDIRTLSWKPADGRGVGWAAPAPPPVSLHAALVQRYRGAGVSWERVLLDLHSGRLFGRIGVALVNVAAVLMLLLALTGSWHFFRRRR